MEILVFLTVIDLVVAFGIFGLSLIEKFEGEKTIKILG